MDDVEAEVEAPLESWRVRWDGDEGAWDLAFVALSAPLALGAGGAEGYEQPCRVSGTVRVGAQRTAVDCLGQRGHQWGAPDWGRLARSRTVSAWLGADRFVCLGALRPEGAEGHAEEDVEAWLVTPEEPEPVRIDEARISTTYDGEGRQLRAGLELWPAAESTHPQRLGGEARCATSLELRAPGQDGSGLRLDAAFFAWRMAGQRGVGRYDVLRRT